MSRARSIIAACVSCGLTASLVACGGGGSNSAPSTMPPTTRPAPVTSVIAEGSISQVGMFVLGLIPVTVGSRGDVDITVDWTFPQDDVDVWLGPGQCTLDQFNQGTCQFVGFSMSRAAKPETVHVPGVDAGEYTLYIGNRGPDTESISYQVVLTTPASASGPGSVAATALGDGGTTWRAASSAN